MADINYYDLDSLSNFAIFYNCYRDELNRNASQNAYHNG